MGPDLTHLANHHAHLPTDLVPVGDEDSDVTYDSEGEYEYDSDMEDCYMDDEEDALLDAQAEQLRCRLAEIRRDTMDLVYHRHKLVEEQARLRQQVSDIATTMGITHMPKFIPYFAKNSMQ